MRKCKLRKEKKEDLPELDARRQKKTSARKSMNTVANEGIGYSTRH
jgi:hypothetical protein